MTPRIVNRESRQLQIANAAGELFGKYGSTAVTIDDVAKAAGIGKGTVYEYFKNKEELIQGAFSALMTQRSAELEQAIDYTLTPLEALRKAHFATVHALAQAGEVNAFLWEYMLMGHREQTSTAPLLQLPSQSRQVISGLLEAAVDAGQVHPDLNIPATAATLAAWYDGAILHWMTVPEPDLQTMATAFWDLFEKGIAPQKE